MYTNDPVEIPMEFEYKFDRTGRKYIVAKRKPMIMQTHIPHNTTSSHKTYTLTRANGPSYGFESTLIFTIFHDGNGKPINGKVAQMVKFPDRDAYIHDFNWIIDAQDINFVHDALHSIDTLKKLWIDATTGNHGKNIPYTEVKP